MIAIVMNYGSDAAGILGGLASLMVLRASLHKRAGKRRKKRSRRGSRR